ncbi:RNA polymerase sigma factor [Sphingobacterium faecale]|uniref:Sigma-70 family RNA polymerase sigma factor n=1 Tax=Sphingobacterium faecale TaxID=2803775 RepID=A0ABS1R451_9SPHI|nr:sigma-70 family RNA polymerase sigma factor [Sphingobacterium faecale]MBL1409463.1 sigma-70 family RNA polymerase sigma factor [Sphingobacterium faecale]
MTTVCPYDERDLLLQLQGGDEVAFGHLYDHYWASLYSYAYNRLRSKELSQDIVQEVFMDMWRRRETLQIDNLSAYLHTAVRFLTYKELKKLPLDHSYYLEFEEYLVSYIYADTAVQEKEYQQLLASWIELLPEKRRKIFLLHYLDGLSTETIANDLGISRKTVQNQLQRAKTELHERYAHYLTTLLIITSLLK